MTETIAGSRRGIFGVVIFASLWEALAKLKNDPAIVPVEGIISASVGVFSDGAFFQNLLSTLRILTIGVMLASAFGFACAIVFAYDTRIFDFAGPAIEVCRNIPSITLFPILLVMYGIGDSSRIFVIFWTAYPAVLLSSFRGLTTIDKGVVEAGYALGLSKSQVMRHINVPLAMPSVINGMRIGTGSGFVAIVVAEMLGATSGIGYMVLWTTNSFRYPETYVYILVIGLLGMTVNCFMEKAEQSMERKCS